MKKIIFAAVAGLVLSEVQALNSDMYAHEMMEAVRPGGVEGSPFWNKYSRGFIYPPAFDFSCSFTTGTMVKCRFTILDSEGKVLTFDAGSPKVSLESVWGQVADGETWVYLSTVDKDGEVCYTPDWPREKFSRRFWKKAAFRAGAYEKVPRSYGEAIRLSGNQIFNFPTVQSFLKSGKPDFTYQYNCYPSKIYGAIVRVMLEQYAYYVPIDSANAKMIQMYLAMYRVEKNPLDLAKARALANALVRIQDPNNGYIPTEYAKVAYRHNPQGGWLNCTCLSLKALLELDEIEKMEVATK